MENLLANVLTFLGNIIKPNMTPEQRTAALSTLSDAGRLNWRTSSDDLLKLCKQPHGYDARKVLAGKLMPGAVYTGTAEQNIELHRLILKEIDEHGIKLPLNEGD